MKTKWLAFLMLAGSVLFVGGCASRYPARYQQPRFAPGYSRYDSRTWQNNQRRDNRRDYRWQNDRRYQDRGRYY